MFTVDVKNQLDEYSKRVSENLAELLPNANDGQAQVVKAMKYSLMNGGKRLRPTLVLEFCKMCGGDVEKAMAYARDHGNDIVFLDTAGRLHVDEVLMDELKRMKEAVQPTEILLVVDAMTGQDAVNAASAFDQALDIVQHVHFLHKFKKRKNF